MTPTENTAQSIFSKEVGSSLANYPHAKRVGDFIYLSGLSARQVDNSVAGVYHLPDGSIRTLIQEQTEAVLQNIRKVLECAGGSLKDLVDLTVFLTNMGDYEEFNKVYNKYFNGQEGPARATVAVSKLPGQHLLVEIKGIAFVPR